ncbi:hypothetical protein DFH07DRAFT_739382 [Mycena maculata]|uniref:Methyltransferase domain-containing protein n=1 Tax=Mycena maculata TaxID=230809 RepID=A0AAD7JD89_9AGAR|nr:hypothetical protein DFH07DRAFT_739382 [Mycena maculata]
MKLHPYPDAPYMQAYDPVVLQTERYAHHLLRRLAPVGSPTFHTYSRSPPASALDLGCGSGLWLLDAARTWRGTQFVGFDLVDVAVPALSDGSVPNVRLVRGDFLKYDLPFPDAHFELVRMANLQLAIPQTQWDRVLREVWRVLVPGGRLELIHDDTFFPYGEVPIEEVVVEGDSIPAEGLLHPATTPTTAGANTTPNPLSPSTPRAPPPTPESGFFDSSDDEDDTTRAAAAADLERVYARMLTTRFGVNPRAGEAARGVLGRVFGAGRVERAMSLHLKLAPVGCEGREDVVSLGEVRERERTASQRKSVGRKKQLGLTSSPAPSASPQPTTPIVLTHTRGGSAASTMSTRSTASAASALSTVSSTSSGAWSATGVDPPRPAHQLEQHPGLVLWPGTFIPLAPAELEGHVTAHMQALLACKPALAEFVGTFKDDEGKRVVTEEEFEDAVWEYECFRRPRFNWPDLPEGHLEGEEVPFDLPTPASATSVKGVPRAPTMSRDEMRGEEWEREPHPFGRHELTHVRTLRIFGAVKGAEQL